MQFKKLCPFGKLCLLTVNFHTYKLRRGLLPAGWQETFWSPTSRLSLTLKSPASRLAGDLKVSYQPAIEIQMNKGIAF